MRSWVSAGCSTARCLPHPGDIPEPVTPRRARSSGGCGDDRGVRGERSRLTALAARVLGDRAEAEDVVQQAWFAAGPHGRRGRGPARLADHRDHAAVPGPAEGADAGPVEALSCPAPRPTPWTTSSWPTPSASRCRWCSTGCRPRAGGVRAARQLRLRLRHGGRRPGHHPGRGPQAGVPGPGAGRAAGRRGPAGRLGGGRRLHGRGPRGRPGPAAGAAGPRGRVTADAAALQAGTPERIEGPDAVAAFFDGSAHAALPCWSTTGPATPGTTAARPGSSSTSPSSAAGSPASCLPAPRTTCSPRCSAGRSHRRRRRRQGAGHHHDGGAPMKTMTCAQLGGPCDQAHTRRGRQRRHQGPGPAPEGARGGRRRDPHRRPGRDEGPLAHPKKSMDWYRDAQRAFEALPEG